MEWIETTGATIDEAKDLALDRLGVAVDELELQVLRTRFNNVWLKENGSSVTSSSATD